MTNELQIFIYTDKEVRVQEVNGEPWFCLKDLCNVLELEDTNKVSGRLDEEDLTRIKFVSGGQTRDMYFVNESGMYDVILRSDKPEAKAFKKWITHEVVPSIRKHGAYMTPKTIEEIITSPDLVIELATKLKREREEKLKLAEQVVVKEEINERLRVRLGASEQYYSIKTVSRLNGISWKELDWKCLKNTSNYLGLEIRKEFDANYGKVNTYHIDAWKHEYPHLNYDREV